MSRCANPNPNPDPNPNTNPNPKPNPKPKPNPNHSVETDHAVVVDREAEEVARREVVEVRLLGIRGRARVMLRARVSVLASKRACRRRWS